MRTIGVYLLFAAVALRGAVIFLDKPQLTGTQPPGARIARLGQPGDLLHHVDFAICPPPARP